MMSLTSVCAPKPIATPTTPAPAISGPICMPMADSAISAAWPEDDEQDVADDRQERTQASPPAGFLGIEVSR